MPNKTPKQIKIHAKLRQYIEQKGVDEALRDYTDPEREGATEHDPELAKLWKEYIALTDRLFAHIGFGSED